MAEEKPGLHIDLDWKKQAQEEKKRLEEEEKKRAEERATPAAPPLPTGVLPTDVGAPAPGGRAAAAAAPRGRAATGPRGERELPPASVQSLAQSLVTQAMYYLSDSAARTGDEASNMDMAKHLIDSLDVLEQKTKGNLTPAEEKLMESLLYDLRLRYVEATKGSPTS